MLRHRHRQNVSRIMAVQDIFLSFESPGSYHTAFVIIFQFTIRTDLFIFG